MPGPPNPKPQFLVAHHGSSLFTSCLSLFVGCQLFRWLLSSSRCGMVGIWGGGGRGAHHEASRTWGSRRERCLGLPHRPFGHASPWCTITEKPVKRLQINRGKAKCLIAQVRLLCREDSHTTRHLLPLLLA